MKRGVQRETVDRGLVLTHTPGPTDHTKERAADSVQYCGERLGEQTRPRERQFEEQGSTDDLS